MIEINSYSDLINLNKLKNIIFNKRKSFPVSNLFDKNYDTFWKKITIKGRYLYNLKIAQ